MYSLSLFSLFDQYSAFIYFLQQYFVNALISTSHYYNITLYLIFICLGVITVLTPCFFSILPLLFLSTDLRNNHDKNLFYYILGLVTSFCIFILVAHSFSSFSIFYRIPIFSYLVLIVFSLNFMRILNLSNLYYSFLSALSFTNSQTFAMSNYLIGLVVGLSSLPCSTPILLVVNLLLLTYKTPFFVFISILFYVLGFILCLLSILNLKFLYNRFSYFSMFWNYFTSFSGSILFIITFSSVLKILFIWYYNDCLSVDIISTYVILFSEFIE